MLLVICSLFILLSGILPLSAVELPDVKSAKNFRKGGGGVVFSESFESFSNKYYMPKQYSIVPREGVNGTSALKHQRSDSRMRPSFSMPLKNLDPETVYNVQLAIRSQNLKRAAGSKQKLVNCAVEYYKNGNLAAIDYPVYVPGDNYRVTKFSFKPRPNMVARFVCYLWHGWTGTVWFDDIKISSAGPDVSVLLVWPTNLTFRTDNGHFKLHADPKSPAPLGALVSLKQAGKTREMVLKADHNFDFYGDFGKLAEGPAEMTVRLLDLKQKQYLYEGKFKLNVIKPQTPPANAAILDKHGRLIVDGKLFMPLGFFGLSDSTSLKRIADAGFNCMQLYSSFSLCGRKKTTDPVADIRAGIDRIHRHKLRLIFSLAAQMNNHPQGTKKWAGETGGFNVAEKAVKCFKNHPAILAW